MISMKRFSNLVAAGLGLLITALPARAEILEFNSSYDLSIEQDGLEAPADIAITDDGRYVYVIGSLANTLSVFQRPVVANVLTNIVYYTDGVDSIDGLMQPWKIALSPAAANDNHYLFVIGRAASTHPDTLAVFERNTASGGLSLLEVHEDDATDPNMGLPSDIVVSPDARYVYVTGLDSGSVAVYEFNATPQAPNPHLSWRQTINYSTAVNLIRPQALAISPDGAHIYATATGADSIIVFARNATTGILTYQPGLEVTEGDMLAGGPVAGLLGPIDIQVSPEGNHVYVANLGGSSVVVFSRDSATGALDYVETYSDGGAGINTVGGLEGITALRLSPDGDYLAAISGQSPLPYVIADLALTLFSRDAVSGALSAVVQFSDDASGSFAIANSTNFEFSRDNRALYTISTMDTNGKIGIYNNCLGTPPDANAGNNISVNEGYTQLVQLDGSGSSVPCGSITHYSWRQIAGPGVTLQDADTAAPSFLPLDNIDQDVDLVFELSVTSNKDVTGVDTVTVTVINANAPPLLSNDLCIIEPGAGITIDVLANDEDNDGPLPLQLVNRSASTQGIVTFGSGNIHYTPPVLASNGMGGVIPIIDRFSYNATDSLNESALDAEVAVLVNELPELQDDSFLFDAQHTAQQTLLLLTNDRFVTSNSVIILPENGLTQNGGSLALNADGTITYLAPANNNGARDEFGYVVVSEETNAFAEQHGLLLVSDNPACLQVASTGRVTINFSTNVNNQKPPGGSNMAPSGGGGSIIVFDLLLLLLVMLIRVDTPCRIMPLKNR